MTLLVAVDPGPDESAWLSCETEPGRRPEIRRFGKLPNDELRELMRLGFTGHRLAIEMIASYGMPVGAEVFTTCMWIGRFIEARGGEHELIYRKDEKRLLCGSMRANDSTIRQALIDRYGPGKAMAVGTKAAPGPLYGIKGDVWAALAVAVTSCLLADEERLRTTRTLDLADRILGGQP